MLKILKLQPHPLQFLFTASALINIFLWLYTYGQYRIATDLVPVHYTIYFGIDLMDYKTKLFTYPIFGILILIVNASLARALRKEPLISYLLAGTALLSEIFITLAFLALVVNYY